MSLTGKNQSTKIRIYLHLPIYSRFSKISIQKQSDVKAIISFIIIILFVAFESNAKYFYFLSFKNCMAFIYDRSTLVNHHYLTCGLRDIRNSNWMIHNLLVRCQWIFFALQKIYMNVRISWNSECNSNVISS